MIMPRRMRQRKIRKRRTDYVREPVWWHVYILHLTDSKKGNIYYTGITQNIGHRMGDYLGRKGNGFVNVCWRDAIRKLVYIENFYGTEFECMIREKKIKNKSRHYKQKLIVSDSNMLVNYFPTKRSIVLQKNNNPEEQILVKIE